MQSDINGISKFIIQWGLNVLNGYQTITLPIAFSNNRYSVIVQNGDSKQITNWYANVSVTQTTTLFGVAPSMTGFDYTLYWFAIGI